MSCIWDKPRKRSQPAEVTNVSFATASNAKRIRQVDYEPGPIPNHDVLRRKWQGALKNSKFKSVASHIPFTSDEDAGRALNLQELFEKHSPSSPAAFYAILNSVCDGAYIKEVEESTRGQADNAEWHRQRKGRLTASMFGEAYRNTVQTPECSLAKKIACPKPFKSIHTEHGIKHEAVARELYIQEHLAHHQRHSYKESGLWVSPNKPWLAASPDGLISCKCCGDGLLEIKCTSKHWEVEIHDIASRGDYEIELVDGVAQLKKSSKWYHQVQAQMYVCRRSYCDFVLMTTRGQMCQRIYYDGEDWENCVIPNVGSFYTHCVYPNFI